MTFKLPLAALLFFFYHVPQAPAYLLKGRSLKMGKSSKSKSVKSPKTPVQAPVVATPPPTFPPTRSPVTTTDRPMAVQTHSPTLRASPAPVTVNPTPISTRSPTDSPVASPSISPVAVETEQPTMPSVVTNPPTLDKTLKATEIPTDDNDDYYDPTEYYDDAWLDNQDSVPVACRCNDENTCLSTPIPPGVNMTLCLFVPESFSLAKISQLVLTSRNNVLDILAANATDMTTNCEHGDTNICVLEFPMDQSLFDTENETTVTLAGTAALEHGGTVPIRAELDFFSEVLLGSLTADILDDGNGEPSDVEGNPSTPRGIGDVYTSTTSKVEWLFPLLAVIVVGSICAVIIVLKRREAVQG